MRDFDRRRAEMDRDFARFDRAWRWLFPVAVVLGVVGSLVTIALYAGAAAWLWSVLP